MQVSMSGDEIINFKSYRRDKSNVSLPQRQDHLSADSGFRTLGFKCLLPSPPWGMCDSVHTAGLAIFFWKQHLQTQALGLQHVKECSAFEGDIPPFASLPFPVSNWSDEEVYREQKRWDSGCCRTDGLTREFTQIPRALFARTGVQVLRFWTGSNLSDYILSPLVPPAASGGNRILIHFLFNCCVELLCTC